ncbi:GTP-binding protein [Amycolatopsis minnesotensis]|uniref:GTP-binding protein n=1 Tax=Amycolatopsis minnesotensis TaxID=337894 RepID=A0ABN2RKS2_9PSEU
MSTLFLPVSGFLGAGKTTTLIAAAKLLEARGRRVAIVTNDQGADLVDTRLARSDASVVGEVTGGCFCCRFEDLLDVTRTLVDGEGVDTVLAEAVGSCTDLQATVVRPLRAYYGDRFTAPVLTTVVEPDRLTALSASLPMRDTGSDLSYLFAKQLEEADVIAVNKTDLLDRAETTAVLAALRASHPSATVLACSAMTGHGMAELVRHWTGGGAYPARDLDVDYTRYASAEAGLAWLNRTLTLSAPDGFDPAAWADAVLRALSESAHRRGWLVGHVKIALDSAAGLTKLSLTAAGAAPVAATSPVAAVAEAAVTVNARVACDPEELDDSVDAAVREAAERISAVVRDSGAAAAFKPGYPRPTHRLPA